MAARLLKKNTWNDMILKWLLVTVVLSFVLGGVGALFLWSLEWVSRLRSSYQWLLFLLPLVGYFSGSAYHYLGKEVIAGNNQVIKATENPQKHSVPLVMAPAVFVATLLAHLVGASVGREGTAIQLSSAIAVQFNRFFKFSIKEQKVLLYAASAAGFGAVFGTPMAGVFFAVEVVRRRPFSWWMFIPIVLMSYLATWFCDYLGAEHTLYDITNEVSFSTVNLFWLIIAAIIFGVVAWVFTRSQVYLKAQLSSLFANKSWIPAIGGGVLLIMYLLIPNAHLYQGLGVSSISNAFVAAADVQLFSLKLLFTVISIATLFKGGEVTPLFFIGATLGSFMGSFLPLPFSFLAGMGFVAVFAGCTKTPLACTVMAAELFGIEYAVFALIACFVAYAVSGHKSIYSSQDVKHKWRLYLPIK